jgi:hypothetical protein
MPEWFDYFLLSCSRNRGIDWLFFTDCLISNFQYSNIFYITMSLNEFNSMASGQLGFEIKIKHPYKLCEFKPAYGRIFEKYLDGYNYWGYGDIDLIYGDILKFLPDGWSNCYEIISTHTEFIPGHLCILRNNLKINSLFREAKLYKKIFQSPVYHGFDEQLHPIVIFPNRGILNISKAIKIRYHIAYSSIHKSLKKMLIYKVFKTSGKYNKAGKLPNRKDLSSIIRWNILMKKLKVWQQLTFNDDLMFRKAGIKKWNIEWNNGTLINHYSGKELMYFHFPLSRNKQTFNIHPFSTSLSSFKITQTGIE